MTIGDVFATVAGVLAICVSFWAALVFTSLVFAERARDAAAEIERAPMRCMAVGLVIGGIAEAIALVLVNQANGLLKLIGWVFLAILLCLMTLGASGLSLFIASRIRQHDTQLSSFAATGKGAGLLVAAGVIPFLGWILFGGSVLTSLGAAFLTLVRARQQEAAGRIIPAAAGGAPSASTPTTVASDYSLD